VVACLFCILLLLEGVELLSSSEMVHAG
jgi:hypothetical protein